MIKLIVFDWDGTLVDSVSKIVACKTFLAKKFNLPIPSEKTIRKVLGMKFEEALSLCFPIAKSEILVEFAQAFHALMKEPAYQAPFFSLYYRFAELFKTKKDKNLRRNLKR